MCGFLCKKGSRIRQRYGIGPGSASLAWAMRADKEHGLSETTVMPKMDFLMPYVAFHSEWDFFRDCSKV